MRSQTPVRCASLIGLRLSLRSGAGPHGAQPLPQPDRELGFLEKLFGELDRQLENAGLILKRGTMLDATLIEAISAPPKEDRPSNDPDARFTKRQGKSGSTFGYKAHMGVDEGSGLIRAVLTTPANVNDTTPADALIRATKRCLGDAAYHTHAKC